MNDPTIRELLQKYAMLGWKHWNGKSKEFQKNAQKQVGVEIVDSQWNAQNAATNPYKLNGNNGNRVKLIPMPCQLGNVTAAFFVPWTGTDDQSDLSFDLVVLSGNGTPST